MKQVISTDKAPAAIGPYSQAIRAGEFLYISGQIPIDPETGAIAAGSFGDLVRQSLNNLKAILEKAGYALEDVVKTTIFLADMGNFGTANAVYAKFFEKDAPARSCVAVKGLPKDVPIEIEAIAWKKSEN
jgi:2-iminobutanoate/2-iminopropanoate deaminase